MKSADGGLKFQDDKEFLNNCAQWTYFTNKNKCSENCEIWEVLAKKSEFDSTLLNDSKNIMICAKINKWIGLDNIDKNYNKTFEDAYGRKQKENVFLDNAIKEMKDHLKKFYEEHITPKLFEYQLLK
jgi:hypothetical protein